MRYVILFIVFIISNNSVKAQNLNKERVWKISSRKRSIYLDRGIFHSPSNPGKFELKAIRNSYVKSRGYERIVLDFDTPLPPRVYGHVSTKESKLYVDLFNTKLSTSMQKLKHVKYIKDVDFFDFKDEYLSLEMFFVKGVSYDVFYLTNPGRVVIDVKK